MSETPNNDDRMSAVDRILAARHGVTRAEVAELSEAEVAHLRRIVAGEGTVSIGDRTKAMAALVIRGDDDAAALIEQVARDESENVDLRAMATTNLGDLPSEEVEPMLTELLWSEASPVSAAAASSLGKVGREEAFEALAQYAAERNGEGTGTVGRPSTFSDDVSREVALARTIIAYRLGRDQPRLPTLPGEDRSGLAETEGAIEIPVAPVQDIEGILRKVSGSLYGISVHRNWGARFGEMEERVARTVLVLNDEYATGSVSDLAERPGIYGILLTGQPVSEQYNVNSLLLVTPDGDELSVAQLRTDGTTMYAGTGRPTNEGVTVTLTDTGRPGTPPTRYVIRRESDDPRLQFEESTVLLEDLESRNPAPLER